jgi:cellulose synthase/poly-beta-1,6-N-acetylglucosamine synthase-like glycosyltransferase
MQSNSKYYSAIVPRRINGTLPHVTVQCPVYKEGLTSVIAPTVRSIKQAISTYELQGGSANIFINDDGMQIIDEDERRARIDFYHDNGIGWTARPKHGEDGFLRRGKFKKASNMNYGLMLSNNVEERLAVVERDETWTSNDEAREYDRCLKEVLFENGRAWADGNIRIGDYILLVDSDTRVPADCFLDAASEMEQSPEVGIMQFSSSVMQVVHTYFENGYVSIKWTIDTRANFFQVSLSSPTSSTQPSATPSQTAMWPLSSATTRYFAGPPSSKFLTSTKMATRNSGPNRTSPKILTCPCVSK